MNTEEAKRYLDPETINAYSLLALGGALQRAALDGSPKRVLNLTRSAYTGQQRYGTVTWSGDVSATWETLRRQIADGLNFCATGLPYWTTDVGGFFVAQRPDAWFWAGDFDAGVEDLGYRELFVRWFQYAAWLPMLRAHGTDTPRELWRFGEPGEPAFEALVGGTPPALPTAALHLLARRLDHPRRLHHVALAPVRLPARPRGPRRRQTSSCSGRPSWCVRSTGPCGTGLVRHHSPMRRRRGACICRPGATGSTSGRTDASRVANRWKPTHPWPISPCSYEPAPSCPWAPSASTSETCRTRHSSFTYTLAVTSRSVSTRTRVTAMATRPARTPRSRSAGMTLSAGCGSRPGRATFQGCSSERDLVLTLHARPASAGAAGDSSSWSTRGVCTTRATRSRCSGEATVPRHVSPRGGRRLLQGWGAPLVATRRDVRKPTIVDIATASGVSVATVSRILNDKPDVAEQTRERVLRVMDEIGFAPQNAWRQIRSGRTGLIAMHVPEEFNPPAHQLIMAAALGVEDAGLLHQHHDQDPDRCGAVGHLPESPGGRDDPARDPDGRSQGRTCCATTATRS